MSGGALDYQQWHISEIADEIEKRIKRQGKKMKYDGYPRADWEPSVYETFPPEVESKMKEAVRILRIAYIYAHRIDLYLSGDDDASFIEHLERELNEITYGKDKEITPEDTACSSEDCC